MSLDVLWLGASSAALVKSSHVLNGQSADWVLPAAALGIVVLYGLSLYLTGLYDLRQVPEGRTLVLKMAQAFGFACIAVILFERSLGVRMPPKLVLLHAALTATFVIAARTTVKRFMGDRWPFLRIGFVGHRRAYAELDKKESVIKQLGLHLVPLGEDIREARRSWEEELQAAQFHRIVVDEDCLNHERMPDFLQECRRKGITVEKLSSFRERLFGKLDLGPHLVSDLAIGKERPLQALDSTMRHARDFVLAGICLLLALPLMLIIGVAVKCDSPGPALFLQDRVGKNGRRFKMFKFRSMYYDRKPASAPEWTTSRRDPRITRVGALIRGFHLDELPQLLNVLKGDMSIVGPRPFHPLHSAQLERMPYFNLRLLALPGITGWAQVRCDYSDSLDNGEEVLARDLYYVKHAGLAFDLMIIAETLQICLRRRGAH